MDLTNGGLMEATDVTLASLLQLNTRQKRFFEYL